MLKLVCAILASVTLTACASFGRLEAAASTPIRSFDSADSAPAEAPIWRASDWTAASPFADLDRRRFSPPSRRQPDLRAILVTAYDRARRPAGRRRRTTRAT
jgi:hypothetical protein